MDILDDVSVNILDEVREKEVYIYGAGNTASLYIKGLEREDAIAGLKIDIKGYIDASPTDFLGGGRTIAIGNRVYPVFSVSVIDNLDVEKAIILTNVSNQKAFKEIKMFLTNKKVKWYTLDSIILMYNKDKVMRCFDILTDERSKVLFSEIISSRIKCEFNISQITKDQYFCLPQFLNDDRQEIFIDVGAYVGDTVERYIWAHEGCFGKIYCFEPDENNFEAMLKRISRLCNEWNIAKDKVCPVRAGIGRCTQKLGFIEENEGKNSKFSSDSDNFIQIYALDDVINEKVGFIKADVESWEYDLILGARRIIMTHKPNLAISIYHNATDLYSIILLLKEMVPEYNVSIRHHANVLEESIAYFWI